MGGRNIIAWQVFGLWAVAMMVLAVMGGCASAGDLPNAKLTPGVINPAVTQANISSTICVKGWTATVRPPAAYTGALKHRQLASRSYGDVDKNPRHYEEDHLISLELGGNPRATKNLWPEAYAGIWNARLKDKLEDRLKGLVCTRKISLADAQKAIATNWIAAYKKFVGSKP